MLSNPKAGDSRSLRLNNMRAVLRVLIDNDSLSRNDIANKLKVSDSTASRITNTLLRLKLIREIGSGKSSGGRAPRLLDFDSRVRYVVGMNISPTTRSLCVADLRGNPVAKIKYDSTTTGDEVLLEIAEHYFALLHSQQIHPDNVLVLGVALPGVANPTMGTVRLAPNLRWNNERQIVSELRERLQTNIKIIVENDVNVGALAEYEQRGRRYGNLIYVRVDSGLGAGIILDHKIWRGTHNFSGEIGYAVIGPQWLEQDYGNRGCLEHNCSVQDVLRRAEKAFRVHNQDSSFISAEGTEVDKISRLYELAEQGNSVARSVVEETSAYLAVVLSNLCSVIDPEIVLVGGSVFKNGSMLFQTLKSSMESVLIEPPLVEQSTWSDDIVTRGITQHIVETGQEILLQRLESI